MAADREHAIEQYLVKQVEKLGGKALKFVSPGTPGVADRLVILPKGVHAFVELKRLGEPLEPLQERFAKDCETLQHLCFRAATQRAVDDILARLEFEMDVCREYL